MMFMFMPCVCTQLRSLAQTRDWVNSCISTTGSHYACPRWNDWRFWIERVQELLLSSVFLWLGVLVGMICQKVSNSMRFHIQTSGWEVRFGKFKDQSINCWIFSILFLYKKILDSNRTEGQRIDRSVKLRPIYMVSGSRDDPPPETTLRSVYMKFNICWPSFGQVTYLTKCRMTGEKWL